jgi:hypothetical protein
MTSLFSGYSGYVTSTQILDNLIATCKAKKLNTFRISFNPEWFATKPHPYTKSFIQYLLDHSTLKIIVDRNHLYPPTADSSNAVNWTQAQTALLEVCADFPNNDRVMIETINEYVNADWKAKNQALVDAIRNAGYTNPIVANKWTTGWSASLLVDPLNKLYMGMHFYFNSWSPSGAETQMGYATAQNLKIINTEVGAHSSEYANFTADLVIETNQFLDYCKNSSFELSNLIWLADNLANLAKYEELGLIIPETLTVMDEYNMLENYNGSWGCTNGTLTDNQDGSKHYTTPTWNGWVWKRPVYGQWWNLKDQKLVIDFITNQDSQHELALASAGAVGEEGWYTQSIVLAKGRSEIDFNQFSAINLERIRSIEIYSAGLNGNFTLDLTEMSITGETAPPVEPEPPAEIPEGQIKSLGTQAAGFVDSIAGIWNLEGESVYAGVDNFRPEAVIFNLQHMKNDFKMSHVRCIVNTTWMQENVIYRNNLRTVCAKAKELGMRVILSNFQIRQGEQTEHPFVSGGFANVAAFANYCKFVAQEFSAYDNVILELWNEPHSIEPDLFFTAMQSAITAMRTVSQIPAMVMWDYKIWNNLQFGGGSTLDWIWTYNLQGTNIIYSTHIYYPNFYDGANNPAITETEIRQGFEMCKVFKALNEGKKLWLTEVGVASYEVPNAHTWFTNILNVLNTLPFEGVTVQFWTTQGHIGFGLFQDGAWLPPVNADGQKVKDLLNPSTAPPTPPPSNSDITIALAGASILILGATALVILGKKS